MLLVRIQRPKKKKKKKEQTEDEKRTFSLYTQKDDG